MWTLQRRRSAFLLALAMGGILVVREATAEDRVVISPEAFGLQGLRLPAVRSDGFSATEFRARGASIGTAPPLSYGEGSASLLDNSTIWQRLREYRSRDRLRLLTLYESSASSLSLQAGKRGYPSLQWTSRAFNHDGATRGVLDRLFSISIGGKREHGSSSAVSALAAQPPRTLDQSKSALAP